ncbi:histidine phosphatase family protein [Curtobacterium sp. Leaf261]|uniref:histidine phosphatase family protein n=1 Tax=Curtobacterium sp. Leaf261 TaxID=1736311 RepID=UPI000B233605|nr:histidine phosphatase family protein [Curtobacterium sp. Leaf261]
MPSFYVSHPEVVVEPAVPIEQWGLSDAGFARARRLPDILHGRVERIVSSAERKAVETAAVLGSAIGVTPVIDPHLGELDRSATGYLPEVEFDAVVEAFFAEPDQSVRGWERAGDAQRRTVAAVRRIAASAPGTPTVYVGHGGVGALLLASLRTAAIDRSCDQPGMGSVFAFDPDAWTAMGGWERIR